MSFHLANGAISVFLIVFDFIFISNGAVQLTLKSPSSIQADVGETVTIRWDYTVSNRNTEFDSTSPVWRYKELNGSETRIAFEDKFGAVQWEWKVAPDCPAKFRSPTLRIGKNSTAGKAALVIKNVTEADTGTYTCELVLQSGSVPPSSVQLTVVPTPTTTVPQTTTATNTTATGSSTAPSSSTTIGSTTKTGKDGDSEALSDGAIAGISVAVIVVVVFIVVLAVCMWKKKKDKKKGLRIPMS